MTDLEIRQEPDQVPGKPIAAVIVATLATIAVSVVAVWMIGDCGGTDLRAGPSVRTWGGVPREIHHVEAHVLRGVETDAERARRQAILELSTWRWVDRDRRRVAVPVDVAIDLYLRQRAGGGP